MLFEKPNTRILNPDTYVKLEFNIYPTKPTPILLTSLSRVRGSAW